MADQAVHTLTGLSPSTMALVSDDHSSEKNCRALKRVVEGKVQPQPRQRAAAMDVDQEAQAHHQINFDQL